jgi:hypothetical protein
MWKRRAAGIFLAASLLFPSSALMQVSASDRTVSENLISDRISSVQEAIRSSVKQPVTASAGGEWAVIGMARSCAELPEEWYDCYLAQLYQLLKTNNGALPEGPLADYARVSLALSAMGQDPSDLGGYDLLAPLSDLETLKGQGLSGVMFALLAYNAQGTDKSVHQDYVDWIVSSALSDGGFANSGTKGDPDMTAIAITALAPYCEDSRIKETVENALAFLEGAMQDDGGFYSYGVETAESAAQVVTALCTLGIDPTADERFCSETGENPLSNLRSFAAADGGYYHVKGTAGSNQMATEQALIALAAYSRLLEQKNILYDMSDAVLVGTLHTEPAEAGSPDVKRAEKKQDPLNFADLNGHWAESQIQILSFCGIVSGAENGLFLPNRSLTRAEFAKMVVGALGVPSQKGNEFSDVNGSEWYAEAALTASYYGLISGRDGGCFAPSESVTREEAAVILAKAAELCGKGKDYSADDADFTLGQFDDGDKTAFWSAPSLAFCVDAGLFSSDAMDIRPGDSLSRAEAAQLTYQLMQYCDLLPDKTV